MGSPVNLSDSLLKQVDVAARVNMRSRNKQVEYWANLGRLAEKNKDLPLDVILGTLQGLEEMDAGLDTPFKIDK